MHGLTHEATVAYHSLNADTPPCSATQANCPFGTVLSTSFFPILNQRCIPESFVCDGVEDCVGGTDEEDCLGKDCNDHIVSWSREGMKMHSTPLYKEHAWDSRTPCMVILAQVSAALTYPTFIACSPTSIDNWGEGVRSWDRDYW